MTFYADTFCSKQVRILSMIELKAIICYILEIIKQFSEIKNFIAKGKILYRKVP